MAWKRGPLSDEKRQAIKEGMARRKAGAPTKKERAVAARDAKALVNPRMASGAIRRQQCIHRNPDDGSGYKTFREIGEGLGVTKNAVNMMYNRAMRKVAEELVKSQRVDGMEPAELAVERIMSMPELEEMIAEILEGRA
jgi:hypothetical protein